MDIEIPKYRTCPDCGMPFEEIPGTKDVERKTVLQQYADHSVIHQSTGEQWHRAYNMIQQGKARAAARNKEQP